MRCSWVEISLSRIQQNVAAIRERLSPSTKIIAVVKANAYGHGLERFSQSLLACDISHFAVATPSEAVELRRHVRDGRILVFGGCLKEEEDVFREYDLTASLFEDRTSSPDLKVEVKIDTGMARLGIPWTQALAFIRQSKSRITGVFSHFASADRDPEFTRLQLKRFEEATSELEYPRHISHSAGLQFPEAHLDAVRLGLALYGISPCPAVNYLEPVLCWKTRILSVRDVPKGQPIGYGGTFVTERDSRVGVLAVGYGDGYNRLLSNRSQVRVRDQLAAILGRISMDWTSVDLTDIPNPQAGEEVTLLEASPNSPISASSLARTLGTIPYEVLTSIGERVERVYLD